AVVAPRGLHRRWRMFLYPLDAKAGADPVCAVELMWLPARPSGAFRVEVKGQPRPFGLVAIRTGDEVWWPRGRALSSRATFPRPVPVSAMPPPVANPPGNLTEPPSLLVSWLLRAAVIVLLAGVLAMVNLQQWNAEQKMERSRPAMASS